MVLTDRSVGRFDPDPTRSFTMPSRLYVDPAVLAEERVRIFNRSWIVVGHVSDLASPGSYVTADIAGEPVFVIRQDDEQIAGFFNVCQHRGHLLLEGRGSVRSLITCPYHAWAYRTDGTLQGARMSDRMEGFDFDEFTLPRVQVEIFCGFVFVNLDADAKPIDDIYPGLRDEVLALHGEPESLVSASSTVFEIGANWKNVGDNLLECYHCHPAHKGFVDLIDMEHYRNECNEGWSVQSGPAREGNGVYDPADGAHAFASIFMWPNLSIGRLPGQRGVFLFRFIPTSAETTTQILDYYGPEAERSAAETRASEFFDDILGPEDVALVESVQVGLRSKGYDQGRFICIPDRPEISEHAVHHFHSMVLDALA
ncbi:MAG: aromatic ring-hydroxylating oxygenase subunit alpha [Acidimicrobiales bacterium]